MYEDFVKRLREKASAFDYQGWIETAIDYEQAADAIEKMSHRETPMKITEIHVDEYYCPACGAENNCDQGYVQDAYCPACGQRFFTRAAEGGRMMVERTCLTCNAEYCKYASTLNGKDRYNYKLMFECRRNHEYTFWKEKIIHEPPKEEV